MKISTVLRALVVIIVAVFLGHQLYSSFYKPIKTESAGFYEMIDGQSISGVIMRGETLVTSDQGGVYHYLVADGNHVANGGVIANIYDSESASVTMSQIDSLTAQIADMTELQNYNNQQATDLKQINDRIDASLKEMNFGCAGGDYEDFSQDAESVLHNLNRRQIVIGQSVDYTTKIGELQSRLNELQSGLPHAKGSIVAAQSGYFSNTTDGYETMLTGENLADYTPEFMDNLKPEKVPGNVVGKIVSDYDWYILAKMPLNDSRRYKVDDRLTLRTEIKSAKELEVTVAQINVSEKKESAVVIFLCSQMSRELASMRTGAMTIVNHSYSGLKVAKSALRVRSSDSASGVYVVSGISLKFVPVEILYSNDDYMICKQEQGDEEGLRLYDEVVVKGKNLYNGKVVE
ncbi:MAG: hypothetical protein MJ132_04320 [Clostridia bacterium]|nr:hypothetical protein [Clostridia bacterium]